MQGVEAYQADFRGANLQLANFGGAYLEGAMVTPEAEAKKGFPPLPKLRQAHPGPSRSPNRTANGNGSRKRCGVGDGDSGGLRDLLNELESSARFARLPHYE